MLNRIAQLNPQQKQIILQDALGIGFAVALNLGTEAVLKRSSKPGRLNKFSRALGRTELKYGLPLVLALTAVNVMLAGDPVTPASSVAPVSPAV